MIHFKWDSHGYKTHLVGCIAHLTYVFVMMIYINEIYINNRVGEKKIFSYALILAIIYPTTYEFVQQYKIGFRKYLSDINNWSDIIYCWGGIANVFLQNTIDSQSISCKIMMSLLLIQ